MELVWRDYDAPEKAVQFGNLFSRLLTLPILTRKKEIILLLQQLSEPLASNNSPRSASPSRPESQTRTAQKTGTRASDSRESPASQEGRLQSHTDSRSHVLLGRDNAADIRNEAQTAAQTPNGTKNDASVPPSEPNLLRDLPFTLQGLSSTNFPFDSASKLFLPQNLPLPVTSLLHTLAEPSLLYRALSDYVQSKEEGLISQSLRAAIGIELRSYLGLIATLEGEIRRTIASLENKSDAGSTTKVGVTLKRCVVWTKEATLGLRLMSLMAEESKSKDSNPS